MRAILCAPRVARKSIEKDVLTASRDRSDSRFDNLVFLCLELKDVQPPAGFNISLLRHGPSLFRILAV